VIYQHLTVSAPLDVAVEQGKACRSIAIRGLSTNEGATVVLAARRTSGSIDRAAGWRVSAWQTGGSRDNGLQKFSRAIYQTIDIASFSKLAWFG
jgi:hypothetical protein